MAPAYPPPLLLGPSSAVAPEAEAFIQKEKVMCGVPEGKCRIHAIFALIITVVVVLIILVLYGYIVISIK
jgi:hypothetical protein